MMNHDLSLSQSNSTTIWKSNHTQLRRCTETDLSYHTQKKQKKKNPDNLRAIVRDYHGQVESQKK